MKYLLMLPLELLFVLTIYVKISDCLIATTINGPVGGRQKDINGNTVYEFLGIPYAKPPIGDLRFKNPVKPTAWKQVLKTLERPNACIQLGHQSTHRIDDTSRVWMLNTHTSEDCLYLSVWTPSIGVNITNDPPKADRRQRDNIREPIGPETGRGGKPVMVWIHGGSLVRGSSSLDVYDGTYLAGLMNVVVVSIQYRLGPLGFLYLGTEDAPGNQGLMDQVAALEWIHENIGFFGGNAQQITLFGHAGGVISVALHLLSPKSSHLFQQAILQSGSPLAWWAVEGQTVAREKAVLVADLSGCKPVKIKGQPDLTQLAKCLRSVDAGMLNHNQLQMIKGGNNRNSTRIAQLQRMYVNRVSDHDINKAVNLFDIPFKPVATSPFIPEWPYVVLRSGKVRGRHRILLGVNKEEICLTTETFSPTTRPNIHLLTSGGGSFIPLDSIPSTVWDLDPYDLLAYYIMDEHFLHPLLLQATIFEYQIPSKVFNYGKPDVEKFLNILSQVAGDYNIKCPVIEFADFYSQLPNSQVFLYSFEHQKFCTHGNEVEYIFGAPFNPEFVRKFHNFTEEERQLSKEMMQMWTNFASTGSPNLNPGEFHTRKTKLYWDSYTTHLPIMNSLTHDSRSTVRQMWQSSRRHMVFAVPKSQMSQNLQRHRCMFWREQLPAMRESIFYDAKCSEKHSVGTNSINIGTLYPDSKQTGHLPRVSSKPGNSATGFKLPLKSRLNNNLLVCISIFWITTSLL